MNIYTIHAKIEFKLYFSATQSQCLNVETEHAFSLQLLMPAWL